MPLSSNTNLPYAGFSLKESQWSTQTASLILRGSDVSSLNIDWPQEISLRYGDFSNGPEFLLTVARPLMPDAAERSVSGRWTRMCNVQPAGTPYQYVTPVADAVDHTGSWFPAGPVTLSPNGDNVLIFHPNGTFNLASVMPAATRPASSNEDDEELWTEAADMMDELLKN